MNLFILAETPRLAAEYHCNKHVVKMILETGQILSTCHWRSLLIRCGRDFKDFSRIKDAREFVEDQYKPKELPPYNPTHPNHPCTLWAGKTLGNYCWALELMRSLLDEYKLRYKKNHRAESVWFHLNEPPLNIDPSYHVTEHYQAVPVDCQIQKMPVMAYRKYYRLYKRHFAKWSVRSIPAWFLEEND